MHPEDDLLLERCLERPDWAADEIWALCAKVAELEEQLATYTHGLTVANQALAVANAALKVKDNHDHFDCTGEIARLRYEVNFLRANRSQAYEAGYDQGYKDGENAARGDIP